MHGHWNVTQAICFGGVRKMFTNLNVEYEFPTKFHDATCTTHRDFLKSVAPMQLVSTSGR